MSSELNDVMLTIPGYGSRGTGTVKLDRANDQVLMSGAFRERLWEMTQVRSATERRCMF